MFAVAMVGSGFLGVAIERVAYKPLRNAPRIAPLISALGVLFFLESSVQLLTNSAHVLYNGYALGGKNGQFGPLLNPVFHVDHLVSVREGAEAWHGHQPQQPAEAALAETVSLRTQFAGFGRCEA